MAPDAADYLRDVLPPFLLNHKLFGRRLQQLLLHLPAGGAAETDWSLTPRAEGASERFTQWLLHSATAEDIRRLPVLLRRSRLQQAAQQLNRKLRKVEARLEEARLDEARLQEAQLEQVQL